MTSLITRVPGEVTRVTKEIIRVIEEITRVTSWITRVPSPVTRVILRITRVISSDHPSDLDKSWAVTAQACAGAPTSEGGHERSAAALPRSFPRTAFAAIDNREKL